MSNPLGPRARATYGSPPMVGERSPKPSMWVRFLPSVQRGVTTSKNVTKIASDSTLAYAGAGFGCA